MLDYKPLNVLPRDIQRDWLAQLQKATPTEKGVFRLVGARRTAPKTYEEQRVTVLVVDENGFSMFRKISDNACSVTMLAPPLA